MTSLPKFILRVTFLLVDINGFPKHSTVLIELNFPILYAISLAKEYNAEILVLHVIERVAEVTTALGNEMPGYGAILTYYEDILKSAQNRVKDICDKITKNGVKAYERVISGNPRYEIIDIAKSEPIDLIVIGTHGRKGFSRLIQGSVAEAVVRHAPCSVLSVKQLEHDFV